MIKQKWQSLSYTQKHRLKIGVGICLVSAVVGCGFGDRVARVKDCTATVTSYVTAEFSEDYLVPYTYSCGETMCTGMRTETRYWDKPASERWTAHTYNGSLNGHNGGQPYFKDGIFVSPMPPINVNYRQDYDFDGYDTHTSKYAQTNFTDGTNAGLSTSDYLGCLTKINQRVQVNTWYGWQYSAEYGD